MVTTVLSFYIYSENVYSQSLESILISPAYKPISIRRNVDENAGGQNIIDQNFKEHMIGKGEYNEQGISGYLEQSKTLLCSCL